MPVSDVKHCPDALAAADPELTSLMAAEDKRQRSVATLMASENFSSPRCRALEGSSLADKGAEGYPGRRFATGCEHADAIERLAVARLKELFGCEHANVQAMNATIANIAAMQAVLQPDDKVLSMGLDHGGHLSHGAPFHLSGRRYQVVHYGVDQVTERIDLDQVRELAKQTKPKLIVCGASSYPRGIDYAGFADIAAEVDAPLLADIAHVSGLMAGRAVTSAVPHAHIVTTSTHKTWRGPRGGAVIMCRREWADAIDRAIFPGIQAAPKMDMIAARAAHFKETAEPEFSAYATTVIANAHALADGLRSEGVRLVTDGTDTHLVLADVTSLGLSGRDAERSLTNIGITTNRNQIPFDKLPPTRASGLRLGSAAITTRGLNEPEFHTLGVLIGQVLGAPTDDETHRRAAATVADMVRDRPMFAPHWLPQPASVSNTA
jgi:glycine hydroxymethyltransferase